MNYIKKYDEWFDNPERLDLLFREMKSWEGTPYKHLTGVKQRGCDCIHFVLRVLETVGALQGVHIKVPHYARDWHMHNGEALLKDGIEKLFPQIEIGHKSEIKNGDVVLFQYGKQAAHAGIYYHGQVFQAITDTGVHMRSWRDKDFYDRVRYIYRIIEK